MADDGSVSSDLNQVICVFSLHANNETSYCAFGFVEYFPRGYARTSEKKHLNIEYIINVIPA